MGRFRSNGIQIKDTFDENGIHYRTHLPTYIIRPGQAMLMMTSRSSGHTAQQRGGSSFVLFLLDRNRIEVRAVLGTAVDGFHRTGAVS